MNQPVGEPTRRGLRARLPGRRIVIFAVIAIAVAAGSAIAYAATRHPVYRAAAAITYGVDLGNFRAIQVSAKDAPTPVQLATDGSQETIQPSVAGQVGTDLGSTQSTKALVGRVTARANANVTVIEAWGTSAGQARALAEAFARRGAGALAARVRVFYVGVYEATHQGSGLRPLSRRRLARLHFISAALTPASATIVSTITPLTLGLVILLGCLLFALACVAVARWLRREREPDRAPGAGRFSALRSPDLVRAARGLFYAGCLLVGESSFRLAAGLTPAEGCFIAAFGLGALGVAYRRERVRIPVGVLVAVGIFALGAAVSSVGALSPARSGVQVAHAIYVLLLWPLAGVMVLRTRRHILIAVTLWTISAAIDGAGALAQLAGIHLAGVTAEGNRMTGFTTHPNDLGGVTAVAFVPALMVAALWSSDEPWVARLSRPVPALFVAIGLVLSGSVASVIAAGVAALVWLGSRSLRAVALVAAIVVCGSAVIALSGSHISSPVQRLSQVADPNLENGGSAQDRLSVADQAWPRISRNPMIGTGLDTADSDVSIVSHGYAAPYQIHGLPLAAWYEAGVFGMIGVVALVGVLLVVALRFVRGTSRDDALVSYALLASFVAFVIVALTQPMVFQQYGWIAPVFVVAWSLRDRPGRQEDVAPVGDVPAEPEAVPVGAG